MVRIGLRGRVPTVRKAKSRVLSLPNDHIRFRLRQSSNNKNPLSYIYGDSGPVPPVPSQMSRDCPTSFPVATSKAICVIRHQSPLRPLLVINAEPSSSKKNSGSIPSTSGSHTGDPTTRHTGLQSAHKSFRHSNRWSLSCKRCRYDSEWREHKCRRSPTHWKAGAGCREQDNGLFDAS